MMTIIHTIVRYIFIVFVVLASMAATLHDQNSINSCAAIATTVIVVFESIYYSFRYSSYEKRAKKIKEQVKKEIEEKKSRADNEIKEKFISTEREIENMRRNASWDIKAQKEKMDTEKKELDFLNAKYKKMLDSGQFPKSEYDKVLEQYTQAHDALKKSTKRIENLERSSAQLNSQLENTKNQLESEREGNTNLRLHLESENRKLKERIWLMTRRVEIISEKLDISDIAKNDVEFLVKKDAYKHKISYEPISSVVSRNKKEISQQSHDENVD